MLVGNLVAGKRIAQAIGRELGVVEDQDLIRKVLNNSQNLNNGCGLFQHILYTVAILLYITQYIRAAMISRLIIVSYFDHRIIV